jgi:hypothetical protein
MSAAEATAPIRHAPLALWRIAQTFLHALCSIFGNPEDVAAEHTLTTKAYTLFLDWLRAGEAILRKLLLIEAAALGPFAAPGPRASGPHLQRQRKLMEFSADKPEEWRVCFRCLARPALRQAQGSQSNNTNRGLSLSKAGPTPGFHSAWPLAERYEALIRAFNNPAPYALRLARHLRAKPQAATALLRDPPRFEYTLNPIEREELAVAAEPVARTFTDTS